MKVRQRKAKTPAAADVDVTDVADTNVLKETVPATTTVTKKKGVCWKGAAIVSLLLLLGVVGYLQKDVLVSEIKRRLEPKLVKKYKSSIVHLATQKLLLPGDSCTGQHFPTVDPTQDEIHIETVVRSDLKSNNLVFIMLNGRNHGQHFKWTAADDCLFELANGAAVALGADLNWLQNGVKFMTQYGEPVKTAEQLDQERIVHVLLDFQIWVWPGIKVGHEYHLHNNITLTTASLKPLVYTVRHFFNQEEAQYIIDSGTPKFERSPVDGGESADGYSADRTSYTAFLDDSAFSRDFRHRTAAITRLPSASFVERLQLVRYKEGQFFRKHEDYFDSKKFLPVKDNILEDFNVWAAWASEKLQRLDPETLHEDYHVGGRLHPNATDHDLFERNLLQEFADEATANNFFFDHADVAWGTWIEENLRDQATGIMEPLLQDRGYMLPHIIKSWEKNLGHDDLRYTIPLRGVNAVSRFFYWIRWAKEQIQTLGEQIPERMQPHGDAYPKYRLTFQNKLIDFMFEDYTAAQLVAAFNQEWYDWIVENRGKVDVLLEVLRVFPHSIEFILHPWETRAGPLLKFINPPYVPHFEPNRFVTLFLYLNDVDEGGETVFPYSKERLVTNIERTGMQECSDGLAVPARALHASLFYSQTPDQQVDPLSMHGGCPPAKGVKFGANSFAWNADADEGADCWGLGEAEE